LSGLVLPTGIKGLGLLSRVEPPTGTKGRPFVQVGISNRDKRPLSPPLARLAFGPGTKATNCPGPKGNRDKWPGTKAYSVVVRPFMPSTTWHWMGMARWPRCTENKPFYNCIDKVSGTKYVLSTEYGPIHIFFGSIVPVICTVYSCLLPTFNRRSHK